MKINQLSNPIKYGIRSLLIFLLLFLSWAIFLPIESASIADGIVVLDFNRKTVQHLEGGIIDQIFVKEGQLVNEGDVLLYLHDIKNKSEQQILQERLWTMKLQRQRLQVEKENKDELNFDDQEITDIAPISDNDKNRFNEIVDNQLKLFRARTDKRRGEIRVLESKLKSAETKLKVFRKEFSLIKPLVDSNNLPILRELDLQKSIAQAEEEAATANLQIANYKNGDLAEILKEIKDGDMETVALYNQLIASNDSLKRLAIKSPTSGKVMNIKYHTIGAVVTPGSEIMSIVPQHEELIIEAKVKPTDIDNIVIGMKTKVSLTAYKGKKVPKINGEVVNISPDIVTNEQTRESYFIARVVVNKKDIENLKDKVALYPGMPAQVFIITGSRSLVSYLFTPISDSAYKAFREE